MEMMSKIKKIIMNSSYYKNKKYEKASDIKELPIIDKKTAIDNYGTILSTNCIPDLYTYTSGSNGMPIKIPWNYDEYLKSLATLWRLRACNGINPRVFYLTCHAEFDVLGRKVDNAVIIKPGYISFSKLEYSKEIYQEYLKAIRTFKPKWLHVQPSFAYYLGEYMCKYAPDIVGQIQYIELVGELLPDSLKYSISDLFYNAKIINMYGMQEFNGIMYESNGALREIKENVYVEILDNDGYDCGYQKEGNIVVTGLHNSFFPLIRYNTKDRGMRVKCNNENGYIITSSKANDEFIWKGKKYDGSIFMIIINEYNKQNERIITQFQVTYYKKILTFNLWGENLPQSENEIESVLKKIMYERFGIEIEITVKKCISHNDFVRGRNKIKYFINKESEGLR